MSGRVSARRQFVVATIAAYSGYHPNHAATRASGRDRQGKLPVSCHPGRGLDARLRRIRTSPGWRASCVLSDRASSSSCPARTSSSDDLPEQGAEFGIIFGEK